VVLSLFPNQTADACHCRTIHRAYVHFVVRWDRLADGSPVYDVLEEPFGRRRPSQISAFTNSERIAKRLHSKQEVARAVSVSPRTLDNWMAEKRIPFIRLSPRLIRFDLERVKTALERYEVKEVAVQK
jgi:excisionase family DNA binding protein